MLPEKKKKSKISNEAFCHPLPLFFENANMLSQENEVAFRICMMLFVQKRTTRRSTPKSNHQWGISRSYKNMNDTAQIHNN